MKRFLLLALAFVILMTAPVFADTWVWEWAIAPTFEVDDEQFMGSARFSEGLATVKKNGKFGYIDKEGKEIIPFIFEKAAPFSEGLAAATIDGNLMGFIRYMEAGETETEKAVETIAAASVTPAASTGERKVAYLTIDDGPSRNITPAMLDILKEHNAKATFFILPNANVDDIFKRIADEGHEVANHSYSHDLKKLYDAEDTTFFEEDLKRAHNYIRSKTSHVARFYRFPGGSGGRAEAVMTPRLEILKNNGYRHFNWDVSTGDTDTSPAGKNVEALVNNVLLNTRDRKKLVILMHDTADKTATVQALPLIIKGLSEMGYVFETMAAY